MMQRMIAMGSGSEPNAYYGTESFAAGVNVTRSIDVGVSGYSKFILYVFYTGTTNNNGNLVEWDASNPSKYSEVAGSDSNSGLGDCKINTSLNDANSTRLGSLVECGGSTVKFKTASNVAWAPALTVNWIVIM